jgi:hypothetical protein
MYYYVIYKCNVLSPCSAGNDSLDNVSPDFVSPDYVLPNDLIVFYS